MSGSPTGDVIILRMVLLFLCCCFAIKVVIVHMPAACMCCGAWWLDCLAGQRSGPSKDCKRKASDWHVADEAAKDLFPLFEDLL
jgi:hypothetical protein